MPHEFWCLTVGEFLDILEGFNKRRKHELYNVAAIIAAIYNTVRDAKKHKEPYKPEDFLPKRKQTQKDLMDQVAALNVMFGGTDSRKAVD